jgi:hypothetical protein
MRRFQTAYEASDTTLSMRYIVILGVAFTLASAFMMFRKPGERRPTPILKASNFQEPEELGAVIFRRFWNEVRQAPVIVLGSSKQIKNYDRVWKGFLAVAKEYRIEFFHVYSAESLASLTENDEKLDLGKLKTGLSLEKPVIVHVGSSTQTWEQLKDLHPQALILFLTRLPLDVEEEKIIEKNCVQIQGFDITCQSAQVLTSRQRKRLNPAQHVAAIEKLFDRLHLVYVYEAQK